MSLHPATTEALAPRARALQQETPPLGATRAPQLDSSPCLLHLEKARMRKAPGRPIKKEKELIDVRACCLFSHGQLFVTPWTVARQTPLSMGLSRQEYWSGLPFPSPGDFLHPEVEPTSLMSPALAGRFFISNATGKL